MLLLVLLVASSLAMNKDEEERQWRRQEAHRVNASYQIPTGQRRPVVTIRDYEIPSKAKPATGVNLFDDFDGSGRRKSIPSYDNLESPKYRKIRLFTADHLDGIILESEAYGNDRAYRTVDDDKDNLLDGKGRKQTIFYDLQFSYDPRILTLKCLRFGWEYSRPEPPVLAYNPAQPRAEGSFVPKFVVLEN